MRSVGFAAVIVVALAAVAFLIAALISGSNDCTRHGGHVKIISWILVGKTLVPVEKCAGRQH